MTALGVIETAALTITNAVSWGSMVAGYHLFRMDRAPVKGVLGASVFVLGAYMSWHLAKSDSLPLISKKDIVRAARQHI